MPHPRLERSRLEGVAGAPTAPSGATGLSAPCTRENERQRSASVHHEREGHQEESVVGDQPTTGTAQQQQKAGKRGEKEGADTCYEAVNTGAAVATAVFTGLLLVVGIWVACYQRELMRGGLDATKKAAEGAQTSAKHIEDSERAWVLLYSTPSKTPDGKKRVALHGWPTTSDLIQAGTEHFSRRLELHWEAVNHGATPARINSIASSLGIVKWPLPDEFQSPSVTTPFHGHVVTGKRPHGHITPLPVTPDDWRKLLNGTHCVAFWGEVRYRTVFDSPDRDRHARFCETWQIKSDNVRVWTSYRPFGPTHAWTDRT